MSIITNYIAVPSRLFAIYDILFEAENGESKDKIESWATPPSLKSRGGEEGEGKTTLFSDSLLEAYRIGLVEEVDGLLRLTTDARRGGKKGGRSEVYFLSFMQSILFDPASAEAAKQSGFMVALSWFLNCNPLKPLNFSKEPVGELRDLIGDHSSKFEISSYAGWQSFLYWARYLGFATIVGGSDDPADLSTRRVIPDPIKAIERVLPVIFANSEDLAIEQFLAKLAAIFPVFETGSAHKNFQEMRLDKVADTDSHLSIATSLALQRLVDRQKLTMKIVADARSRILNFGVREERVSRIILRGKA